MQILKAIKSKGDPSSKAAQELQEECKKTQHRIQKILSDGCDEKYMERLFHLNDELNVVLNVEQSLPSTPVQDELISFDTTDAVEHKSKLIDDLFDISSGVETRSIYSKDYVTCEFTHFLSGNTREITFSLKNTSTLNVSDFKLEIAGPKSGCSLRISDLTKIGSDDQDLTLIQPDCMLTHKVILEGPKELHRIKYRLSFLHNSPVELQSILDF